jgi:hypothetical protein
MKTKDIRLLARSSGSPGYPHQKNRGPKIGVWHVIAASGPGARRQINLSHSHMEHFGSDHSAVHPWTASAQQSRRIASAVASRYDIGVTIRRITACGRMWAWRVRPDVQTYPGYVLVRIWPRGAGGDAARLDVRVRFDDPWLNFGPIVTAPAARVAEVFQLAPVTPRLVAAAIAQALARNWNPDARGTTTTWGWRDGALTGP